MDDRDKVLLYVLFILTVTVIVASLMTLNFLAGGFALIVFLAYFVAGLMVITGWLLAAVLIWCLFEKWSSYGGEHKRSIFQRVLRKLRALRSGRE